MPVKDSADFIRIVQEPDSGSNNYKVLEYFKDGKRKLVGEVSSFEPTLVFEGAAAAFRNNGSKLYLKNYINGVLVGNAYYYYPNGKLQMIREYSNLLSDKNKVAPPVGYMEEFVSYNKTSYYRVIKYLDSIGIQSVTDGNGYCRDTGDDGVSYEQGYYRNGVKDSIWKGISDKSKFPFDETYELGKFISGRLNMPDGNIIAYLKIFELPTYKGGISAFSKYLSSKITYPSDAVRQRISGRVILSFVVEKNGELTDIKCLQPLWPSLDAEAIQVLKKSGKWMPGKYRGLPVRIVFTQPIAFAL